MWNKTSAEQNREWEIPVGKSSIYRSAQEYMKWSAANCLRETVKDCAKTGHIGDKILSDLGNNY